MKTQLIGIDTRTSDYKQDLIQKRLTNKLKKYLARFETHIQNSALTIKRGARWGYHLRFTMILPKNEKIFAEASGETITQTLVPLRAKITKQLKKYRSKLNINSHGKRFLETG